MVPVCVLEARRYSESLPRTSTKHSGLPDFGARNHHDEGLFPSSGWTARALPCSNQLSLVFDEDKRVALGVHERRRRRSVLGIGMDPVDGLDAIDFVVVEDNTTSRFALDEALRRREARTLPAARVAPTASATAAPARRPSGTRRCAC